MTYRDFNNGKLDVDDENFKRIFKQYSYKLSNDEEISESFRVLIFEKFKNDLLDCYSEILKENKWKFSPNVNNYVDPKIKANLMLEDAIKNITDIFI